MTTTYTVSTSDRSGRLLVVAAGLDADAANALAAATPRASIHAHVPVTLDLRIGGISRPWVEIHTYAVSVAA